MKPKKHNSKTRKSSETSRPNPSTSKRSQRSHKPRKHQEPQERCKSKRKRQVNMNNDAVDIYSSIFFFLRDEIGIIFA